MKLQPQNDVGDFDNVCVCAYAGSRMCVILYAIK
jgi:hypothetical protein